MRFEGRGDARHSVRLGRDTPHYTLRRCCCITSSKGVSETRLARSTTTVVLVEHGDRATVLIRTYVLPACFILFLALFISSREQILFLTLRNML